MTNGLIIKYDRGKVEEARLFAMEAHKGQKRKYSEVPYIVHPTRVAHALKDYLIEGDWDFLSKWGDAATEMLCAAYLHDVVEDTPITLKSVDEKFGAIVAGLVNALTKKPIEGNRAAREAAECERISKLGEPAKIIKYLDRIDNLGDMYGSPKGFAYKYVKESRNLAEALGLKQYLIHEDLMDAIELLEAELSD